MVEHLYGRLTRGKLSVMGSTMQGEYRRDGQAVVTVIAVEALVIPISSTHRELSAGINFFFAVLPDDHARSEIAAVSERFCKSHRVSGSLVGADSFHLLLSPMGSPERPLLSLEGALLAAAADVHVNAFEITLDSAMRFSAKDDRFPFVLCTDSHSTESALRLRKAIAEAQRKIGLQVTGVSSYLPHVTLLHGHAVDAIQEAISPIRWTAREFVLIRSFFGQSRHEVVERWPLEPARIVPEAMLPDLMDLSELADLPDFPLDE
jgi:2'-5' RNA ligase